MITSNFNIDKDLLFFWIPYSPAYLCLFFFSGWKYAGASFGYWKVWTLVGRALAVDWKRRPGHGGPGGPKWRPHRYPAMWMLVLSPGRRFAPLTVNVWDSKDKGVVSGSICIFFEGGVGGKCQANRSHYGGLKRRKIRVFFLIPLFLVRNQNSWIFSIFEGFAISIKVCRRAGYFIPGSNPFKFATNRAESGLCRRKTWPH